MTGRNDKFHVWINCKNGPPQEIKVIDRRVASMIFATNQINLD